MPTKSEMEMVLPMTKNDNDDIRSFFIVCYNLIIHINLGRMIKQELDKLSNDEKLIIIYWRIIDYPRVLSVEEIALRLNFTPEFISETIKKFNHNVRLKLEIIAQQKELYLLLEQTYERRYILRGLD